MKTTTPSVTGLWTPFTNRAGPEPHVDGAPLEGLGMVEEKSVGLTHLDGSSIKGL